MVKKAVNINHLAARLNLSKGTISRVLNDEKAPFALETRQRVLAAAAEMGYQPNPIARALATGRTGSVAFWIRHLANSYDSWVARSFEAQVENEDVQLVIRLFGRDLEKGIANRKQTFQDRVDGIVTHGLPPKEWALLNGNNARRVPIVITGDIADPTMPDYVGINLVPAARAAVEHLVQPGRRRVGFLAPANNTGNRYQAYMSVMHDAGLVPEVIAAVDYSRPKTRAMFREYVAAHGCPEGLFCYNDDTAIAAYRALYDLGMRVPDDVALVGCDGIEDTEYLYTPLTTIIQPIEEMCRLAWAYLEKRMQEPDAPPQRIILEPTLVIRESSS